MLVVVLLGRVLDGREHAVEVEVRGVGVMMLRVIVTSLCWRQGATTLVPEEELLGR